MKLAICTDVFADLSYTDMLDKVKSLGIDAVEMTAGGWGARNTATRPNFWPTLINLQLLKLNSINAVCAFPLLILPAIRSGRPKRAKRMKNPCTTAPYLPVNSA